MHNSGARGLADCCCVATAVGFHPCTMMSSQRTKSFYPQSLPHPPIPQSDDYGIHAQTASELLVIQSKRKPQNASLDLCRLTTSLAAFEYVPRPQASAESKCPSHKVVL